MKNSVCAMMTRNLACLMLAIGAHGAQAAESSISTEAIINVPVADAWLLFTSEDGLKSMGYTQVQIAPQLGGPLQIDGGAVPLTAVSGEIISLDPEHMLSFKPAGGASNEQWTVLYFTAMGTQMTQLRWLDFFPEAQRETITARQQQLRQLFDQLIRRFAPECEVCKEERERAQAGEK
jgi:uncharacterized protein YndB with AHSA1/START domain